MDTTHTIPAPAVWSAQPEQQQQEGPEDATPTAPTGEAATPAAETTAPAADPAAAVAATPADVARLSRSAALDATFSAQNAANAQQAAAQGLPAATATAGAVTPAEHEEPLEVDGGTPIPFASLDPATQTYVRSLRAQAKGFRLERDAARAGTPAAPAAAAPETPAAPAAVTPEALAALTQQAAALGLTLAPGAAAPAATTPTAAAPAAATAPAAPAAPTGPTPEQQLAALRIASRPEVSANGDRLLDSLAFRTSLAALESTDATGIAKLVTDTIARDASLRVTPAAQASGGIPHSGTTPVTGRKTREEAVKTRYANVTTAPTS